MTRLAIVVPYRERRQHLDQFVPHMRAYFARDKLDKDIDLSGADRRAGGRPAVQSRRAQERGLPAGRGAVGLLLLSRHRLSADPGRLFAGRSPDPDRLVWRGGAPDRAWAGTAAPIAPLGYHRI
jgi:hypothetical protein